MFIRFMFTVAGIPLARFQFLLELIVYHLIHQQMAHRHQIYLAVFMLTRLTVDTVKFRLLIQVLDIG